MHKTLVSVDTLKDQLDNPDWVIFDCRFMLDDPHWGRNEFDKSHIPGAQYAGLEDALSEVKQPDTGRHPLPDPEEFTRWLGHRGVAAGRQVVAYDQAGGMFAARLWWMLRWLGHDSVAVLDGGWAAWSRAGGPVTDETHDPEPADFRATAQDGLWLSSEKLAADLSAGRVRLVDARGAPRFRGDAEPIDPVAGHVPGAVNLPFEGNLDDTGRFKDPAALKRRFQAVAAGAEPVVHMCGSGVTACHNLLAMEVAGLGDSLLYPGSWSEWVTDPERPVATGE